MRVIDPAEHAYSDIYKLMIGVIVPRPIAFVSTVDAGGTRNLAPFSNFTGCGYNPPWCASARRCGRVRSAKKTLY